MEVRAETCLLTLAAERSLVIFTGIEGGRSPDGVSAIEEERGRPRDGEYG